MENVNLLPENEYTETEGRKYINPNLPVEETNTFIENLRDTQKGNLNEISMQTESLGTAVPSNLGGLMGGQGYWTSRYVTPQTNSAVANLRATAQATALNEALANEKAMWDKRYQEAYRNYQKRQNDKTNGGGGGGDDDDDPDYEPTEDPVKVEENPVVVPEPETTDTGVTSAVNAYAGVTGGGKVPTSTSIPGILYDKDGNATAIKVYVGKGIEVAGGMSYDKDGARKFLQDWVKNGGRVSNGTNAPLADNLSINLIAWKLY